MTTNSDDTNVANNVVQPKVQDLTEQWKKGELEQGWYYIECIDLPKRWIDVDYYRNDCYEDEGFCKGFFDHNDWRGINKVLAPVPSYDDFKRIIDDWRDVSYENKKLKELLISAKDIIEWYSTESGYIDLPTKGLLTAIDNAIGEKK